MTKNGMSGPAVPSAPPAHVGMHIADGATLLDVREVEEWMAGHAPDAVHVPLGAIERAELPAGPILTICRSGARSEKAAVALMAKGRDVTNIEGGMQAWRDAGLPVVTSDGKAGRIA